MIEKVKRILGLGSPKTGNKLIISVEKLERRVALLENGRLEEYNVERNSSRNIVGSVYKGKVRNIEMGLKAFSWKSASRKRFPPCRDAIPPLDSGRSNRRERSPAEKGSLEVDIPNIYRVVSEGSCRYEMPIAQGRGQTNLT